MGTSNFNRLQRADKYYTVLMNYEDDNGEIFQADETDIECLNDSFDHICLDYGYESNTDNHLPSATKTYEKSFGDVIVEIYSKVETSSGYYEGANLDYTLSVYVYGCGWVQCDSNDDIKSQIECVFDCTNDMNEGMKKIQTRNAQKWVDKIVPIIEAETNKMLSQLADEEMVSLGTFSNGETIYQKV